MPRVNRRTDASGWSHSTSYCAVSGRSLSEERRNISLNINIVKKSLDQFMRNIKIGYQEKDYLKDVIP